VLELDEDDSVSNEQWQAWADTMRERYVTALSSQPGGAVLVDDEDMAVFLAVLDEARNKGLKRSRLGWDEPGLCGGGGTPMVGMNAEKLRDLFAWEPVRLGVGFNHLDRIHVFLELEVSDIVLRMLAAAKNELWCEFVPLFRLGRCYFSENTCLKMAHVRRGSSPNYGFIEFMEYLVKAEEEFAEDADYCCDLGGSLTIAWSIFEGIEKLTDEAGKALRIINRVYSQCIRKTYLSKRERP
jgi:hypothetical protein